jgi:tetratricopeptide (TPR) repeat protein
MQSRRTIQIGLAVIICGVIAFIFLNGKNKSSAIVDAKVKQADKDKAAAAPPGFNFESLEKDIVGKLEKPDADKIMVMKGRLNGRGVMDENLLVLAQTYERLHQPALAGFYFEKLTHLEPNAEKAWFGMGKNFFDAEQTVNDQPTFNYFVELSHKALQKVLEMDPNGNLEAMTDQAVNILENNSQPPMEGVGLLRKVVQIDSNNRKALNYLGLFSMQSNQYGKAIERFEHLVKLGAENDPNYPYYYRSLGQAYAGAGKKNEAIEAYKKYKSLVTEDNLKQEADKLIESIH